MALPKRPQKPQTPGLSERLPSRPLPKRTLPYKPAEPEPAPIEDDDFEDAFTDSYPETAPLSFEDAEKFVNSDGFGQNLDQGYEPSGYGQDEYEDAYDDDEDEYEYEETDRFGVDDPNEDDGAMFQEQFSMNEEEYEYGSEEEEENTSIQALVDNVARDFSDDVVPAITRFFDLLDDDDVSEIVMNEPKKIGYKKRGRRLRAKDIEFPSTAAYHDFINKVVLALTDTSEEIDGLTSFIEGRLTFPATEEDQAPLTARVTIIPPPVVPHAKVTIAKKSRIQYSLDDMVDFGSMSVNMMNFMKSLANGKATVVFSGVSGAGKTTLIEAMAYHFDPDDRVIVVEDTPELRIPTGDVVNLIAKMPRPGLDENDVVSMEWLVKATNRMRPERIIVGECRGGEFAEFLLAANSGADGSMTTIHAANPRSTLDKMISLSLKNGSTKSESAVIRDISSTVQIIVQADIIDDRHVISKIEEISNMTTNSGSIISSQTIFEYDRITRSFHARNQPSEQLRAFLEQRGVTMQHEWFRS